VIGVSLVPNEYEWQEAHDEHEAKGTGAVQGFSDQLESVEFFFVETTHEFSTG